MFATAEDVRAGIAAFNLLLAEAWSSRSGELSRRLSQGLMGMDPRQDLVERVEELDLRVEAVPELRLVGALGGPGELELTFAAPGAGSWSLALRARIRPGGIFGSRTFQIRLEVERLRVEARIRFARTSPLEARFLDSAATAELQGVRLDSSNFLLRFLLRNLVNPLLRLLRSAIEKRLREELGDLLPQAAKVQAIERLHLGALPVEFAGETPDLGEVYRRSALAAACAFTEQAPSGSLLDGLDAPAEADSPPQAFDHFHDSAIWTGHFLAGEVLRGLGGDAAAGELAAVAIGSLDQLADLTDERGLLSRVLVAAGDPALAANLRKAEHADRIFTSVDGRFLSQGEISRDQYAGFFLGLGLGALLLGDDQAAARERARETFLAAVAYLERNQFCAQNVADTGLAEPASTATTWITEPFQLLAIVRAAARLDPGRFGPTFERLRPLGSIDWIFLWLETLDPNGSYFKFNLEHSLALLLAEAEPEPAERAELLQGFRVLRHYLRFHANAWFNLVELTAAGHDDRLLSRPRQEIVRETRFLLHELLDRPELIERQRISWPAARTVQYPDQGSATTAIAGVPVPVPQRPGTDFLWQRSPFSLEATWDIAAMQQKFPGLFWRSPRVDLSLPAALAQRLGL